MLGFDAAEVQLRIAERRGQRVVVHRISDEGTCFRSPWPPANRDLSSAEVWHLRKVGPGKGSWE